MIKFGTDGWRAVIAEDFTFDGVRQVAGAIASYVLAHHGEGRGVVVGYDTRFLSTRFADAAARVLLDNGIRVLKTDRDAPTPVVAHAVKATGAFGAVMITASHNPPEYNGIKFIPEYAGPASPEITGEIERYLASEGETRPGKRLSAAETIDPRPAYLESLRKLVDTEAIARSGLPVFYDAMYATGRGYLDKLLERVSPGVLHDWPDPLFGGGMPEPKEEFLGELKKKVVAAHGIGLATDGDADRFGVIDSDGSYVTPNELIALLLYYLVEHRGFKGAVARTIATTHLIDRIAARYGLPVRETPVGFKHIGACMREEAVIIGGEESGGLSILGHLPEKDGILACALATEMRCVTGKPLLDTLRDLMVQVGAVSSRRVDMHIEASAKDRLLASLKENPPGELAGLAVERIVAIDGLKLLLAHNNWVLIRPSGTEPLIRIYFESDTPARRDILISAMHSLIERVTAS